MNYKSMNIIKFNIFIYCLLLSFSVLGQTNDDLKHQYIEQYKTIAIEQMNKYGIPASITLAQGILESDIARSRLALKGNNHFGIKCHKGWTGKRMYKNDDAIGECFRKYKSPEESFKDHSIFLTTRDRYAFLFKLDITDYKGWAKGLKKAGYATNPKYPQLLINIIETYELYLLDRGEDIVYTVKEPIVEKENETPDNKEVSHPKHLNILTQKKERTVYENNGKKMIIATSGDSFFKIANDFGVSVEQLIRWNDFLKHQTLKANEYVYLQPKRWRNKIHREHVVKANETWYSIAQYYGIRVAWLQIRNIGMGRLKKGDKIKLG